MLLPTSFLTVFVAVGNCPTGTTKKRLSGVFLTVATFVYGMHAGLAESVSYYFYLREEIEINDMMKVVKAELRDGICTD